ncbi:MAG TPA: HAMP domain-containing sensor histidine kinase [Longimicrobiales bacterium]|nr:HAMP domain-containing sensor histidine kinase [Longimicrobiales bacterium]
MVGRPSPNGAGPAHLWQEKLERAADRAAPDRYVSEQLAMVSHELRNCLGAIRIATSLIKLNQRQPDAAESARQVIERRAAQMSRLIDDLLEVALREVSQGGRGWPRLRCERVDLRVVARHALESVAAEIGRRNQRLTVTLPEAPVWLQADAGRLEQVLVNLLGNASKYTDDAGEVRLSVQHTAGEATVRVGDSGTGIAPDVLPHVFDPFVQAHTSLPRAEQGIGIGLTVVRDLTELQGGRVTAASGGLGQGSEFTVHLPLPVD